MCLFSYMRKSLGGCSETVPGAVLEEVEENCQLGSLQWKVTFPGHHFWVASLASFGGSQETGVRKSACILAKSRNDGRSQNLVVWLPGPDAQQPGAGPDTLGRTLVD